MSSKVKRVLTVALGAAALVVPAAAHADTIRVQSTTDTVDAGLVDGLLRDAYAKAQPGDTLNYVGVGTGAALTNARNGLADVVITHAPSLEQQFVADGFSLEPYGRAIFSSDYVVLGPKSDPAGVLAAHPHDAISAFEDIAAAGAAGKATFVSRGDNSGTNVQEQTMWGLTGASVPKAKAYNAGTATNRFEPAAVNGTSGYPAWYRITNKGQAAGLQDADVCATSATNPNGGCYTMVDRGTFNRLVNSGTVTNLKVVSDRNTKDARGGQNLLVNPFSAYIVNPDKFTADPKPNVPAATRFVDFLTSASFQEQVNGFPSASDPAFRADAFPTVTATPPASGVVGQPVTLDLTLTDKLPGGGVPSSDSGVIAGLPVQLQQSTDGTNFTDVGGPVATDAAGKVSFRPVLAATTTYRVSLPRFQKFSPNQQTIGVVAAPATGPATPLPQSVPAPSSPTTPTAPAADRTAPTVSSVKLAARKLTLRLSEGATVRATIRRRTTKRVGGRTRTTYTTVKSVTLRGSKAGSVSRSFGTLRAGTYRVTLRATDAAGNARTRTVTLRVRSSSSTRAGAR